MSRENTTYTDDETGRTSFRLAGSFGRFHLSNTINWNDNALEESSEADVDGVFQATGRIGKGRITAGLNYDLGDKQEISQYKLSGSYPISDNISAGASLLHETGDIEGTSAEINLGFDTGTMTLSPKLTYDNEGNYSALLSVSFSLGQDPVSKELQMQSEKRSGRGAATAFVYHDANNNKVFDQDDTPLPEVKVIAKQVRKKGETNEHGVAKLTNLSAFVPTEVEIDTKSLADPFWQPTVPGVAIMPRSASVQRVEFPVVTTGEIEGTVWQKNDGAEKNAVAKVHLELRDQNGVTVQTTTSEQDGFYLFEKVLPGSYTLHVTGEDPRAKDLADGSGKEVLIGNDGTIARGTDIILRSPATGEHEGKNQPPATPVIEKSSKKTKEATAKPVAQVAQDASPKALLDEPQSSNRSKPQATVPTLPATPKVRPSTSTVPPPATDTPSSSIAVAPLRVEPGSASVQDGTQGIEPLEESQDQVEALAPSGTDHRTSPAHQAVSTAIHDSAAPPPTSSITLAPLEVASSLAPRQEISPAGHAATPRLAHPNEPPILPSPPQAKPSDLSAPGNTSAPAGQTSNGTKQTSVLPAGDLFASTGSRESEKILFGVHLASYKSMKSAKAGVQILAKRLNGIASAEDLAVTEVHLGQKGIFYRVTCGRFHSKRDADRFAARILPLADYARSIRLRAETVDSKPTSFQLPMRPQADLGPALIAAKYAAMQQRK